MKDVLKSCRLPEPTNYYEGVGLPSRPVSENALLFLRTSREALQQKHLANRLHHRYVLLYALETAGIVSVEGKSLRIEPGQALLVLPNQFHHYISLDRDELRWLFITFELRQGGSSVQHLSHRHLRPDRSCENLWAKMVEAWNADRPSDQAELLPILDQLLLRISRFALEAAAHATAAAQAIETPDDWIARVESLVIGSIREGRDLESVARAVGLSSRHLRTRFERATGVSLRDYRASYQLSRSIALMQNTDLRLGEIGELCGFNSAPVFSHFMRRHTGRSPNALRRELRSKRDQESIYRNEPHADPVTQLPNRFEDNEVTKG